MTTMKFNKSVEEIEQPISLAPDYYLCRITKAPEIKPNKAKKAEKPYADGGGDNLEVSLVVIHDNPEINGRRFTLYFQMPQEEDLSAYDGRGMLLYDKKMELIANFARVAKGCAVLDEEVTILPNATVGVYIDRAIDFRDGETIINNINIFDKKTFIEPDRISEMSVDGDSEDTPF